MRKIGEKGNQKLSILDTNNIITKGIVLSDSRYKETSKIVSIFTEERGKINIFVSGALRPKSGLMMVTEKFVESEFKLTQSRSRYYIDTGKIINSNLEIGMFPRNYFIAELICEIILKTMPENLIDKKIYNLTTTVFSYLRKNNLNPLLLKIGFMIKYISIIGFKPQINQCVDCMSRDYNNMYFSNKLGGLICGNCLENDEDYVKISKVEIEVLNKLLYEKFSDYDKLDIKEELLIRVEKIIHGFMLYSIDLTKLDSQKKFEKLYGI